MFWFHNITFRVSESGLQTCRVGRGQPRRDRSPQETRLERGGIETLVCG